MKSNKKPKEESIMYPRIEDLSNRESDIQKEIIETMSNSYYYTKETPLQKCLAYYFDEWKEVTHSSAVFNGYPLYNLLTMKKGKYHASIMDVIRPMFPGLESNDITDLASWSTSSWVKDVNLDNEDPVLRNYALAAAINTEFDVYLSAGNIQGVLELKLKANFGKNYLVYQPFRQLLALNILSRLYGNKYYSLYLVTMKNEELLVNDLKAHYPQYLDDSLINMDLIKPLSWKMIKEWMDREGTKNFPELIKLNGRLKEYIETASDDSESREIQVPQFISETFNLRPTGAGRILNINGSEIIGFYAKEVEIYFSEVPSEIRNTWIQRFEDAGFGPTPKKSYWRLKHHADISLKTESLLKEFISDALKKCK